VSKPDDDGRQPERIAFKELEGLVTNALDRLSELRARAESAEGKNLELSELLRRFTQDEGEAGRFLTRLRSLEAENADLRGRLEKGREGVERLLAKIRFLEEQR
jgi:predicted nuclease with TOPRIM domain